MAGERIKLFEADIDVDGIIKKSVELKQEMSNLRLEQQKLKSTVGETSEEYIKSEAQLKKVSAEYRINQQQVSNLTSESGKLLTVEQKLTAALNKEVASITSAAKNNKELKKIRNEVNVETEEGQKVIAEINKKLDENTEVIKGNVSALEEQKIGIGGYKNQIKDAISEMNPLNSGFSGMITGLKGVTKASLGFIATPIGALLAVLVGAFALVKNAMNRSEDSTNKIKKAFSAFSGIVSKLMKILEPLGKFLIDGIVKGMELVEKGVYKAMENMAKALDFLGFDKQAKSLRNFNAEVQQGAKDAKALADAEAQLTKSQRESRKVQLDYQKDAEKLRQIRDNENLSIKERTRANEELGVVLQNQLADELKIAEQALIVSNLRIKAEGETAEALDEQAEVLTTIADIQERITSQQSEQLTNRVSLQRDASEKAKEFANKRIETAEKELELLREQRRFNIQNLEELKFFAEEEIRILDKKLNSRIISETEYKTEVLKINNNLKEAQIEFNESELERIKEFNDRKNEIQAEIDLRNIENANERAIAKADQDLEKQVLELEELQLNEQQKTELLALITTERQQIIDEINKAAFDKQLQDYKAFSQAEINQRQANAKEVAGIASQLTSILTGLLGDSIGAKLASLAIDAAIQAGLVATTSAASQATNLAQATATAAPPFNLPFIAAALGQNAVLQASSTKAITKIIAGAALKGIGTLAGGLKKAEHGMAIDIGGNRHSQGGTKFYGEDGTNFEAERGEKMFVLNRQASAALGPLLSDINQQYGGVSLGTSSTYLAAGGQVLRNSQNKTIKTEVIDYDKLASMLTEGVKQGSMEGTSKGAYSGIADREDYIDVASGADF